MPVERHAAVRLHVSTILQVLITLAGRWFRMAHTADADYALHSQPALGNREIVPVVLNGGHRAKETRQRSWDSGGSSHTLDVAG